MNATLNEQTESQIHFRKCNATMNEQIEIQIHLKRKGNFCEQTLIQIHFKQVYFFVTLVIDNWNEILGWIYDKFHFKKKYFFTLVIDNWNEILGWTYDKFQVHNDLSGLRFLFSSLPATSPKFFLVRRAIDKMTHVEAANNYHLGCQAHLCLI